MRTGITKPIAIGLAIIVVLAIIGGVILYNYLGQEKPKEEIEEETREDTQVVTPISLKIGVLPVIDALPYHIAVAEGLAREKAVELNLIVFPSAKARDDAFIAGQLDGLMTDLVGALLLREAGFNVTILLSKKATFYLVVSPPLAQKVTNINDIRENVKTIAISRGTVIDFALHKMLTENRLDASAFEIQDIRVITERFAAVLEGRVDAAVLPEPWGPLAQSKGAKIVCSVTIPIVVLAIDKAKLSTAPDAAERLSSIIVNAARMYRENTEKYRTILEDRTKIGVPSEFAGWWVPRDLLRPDYVVTGVDSSLFAEVVSWMKARGYITRDYTPQELTYGQ